MTEVVADVVDGYQDFSNASVDVRNELKNTDLSYGIYRMTTGAAKH